MVSVQLFNLKYKSVQFTIHSFCTSEMAVPVLTRFISFLFKQRLGVTSEWQQFVTIGDECDTITAIRHSFRLLLFIVALYNDKKGVFL